MSKIAFFCIPAHGHTNPTLGVVKELVERGNEVRYYSYNSLREKIEETGAEFISCDAYDHEQNLKPEDGARIAKDLVFATSVLVDTTLALGEAVEEQMIEWKPDCIVGDSMAVWAKAIAMKQNIPFISSTTTFAFNRYSAKYMQEGGKSLMSMLFSMPKIRKQIKRLQTNGYPINSILDIIQNDNDTDTIVYTSPEFQPFSDTFSDKYEFVGPSIRSVKEPFEKKKEKLVYISMGTVNNDMVPFYRACIDAFKDGEYQVVISVGDIVDISVFEELPQNIEIYKNVDQIAVLEKADAFLTHCGMNSTSESMYFKVPVLMYPQTNEQKAVAARIQELGAGIRLEQEDPQNIKNAVERLLNDEEYRKNASVISDSFKQCSGVKGAADKIEKTCAERCCKK